MTICPGTSGFVAVTFLERTRGVTFQRAISSRGCPVDLLCMRTARASRVVRVVVGSSAAFAASAFAVTWIAAAQRHAAIASALPALKASDAAAQAAMLKAHPSITMYPMDWSTVAPSPTESLAAIGSHVMAQSLVFAAVAALVAVLVVQRHRVVAGLATVGLVLSVVASAGPLALLPTTLSQGLTSSTTASGIATLFPVFESPLWWRALVGALVGVLLLATVLRVRTVQAPVAVVARVAAATPWVVIASLAAFGLIVLLSPDSLGAGNESAPISMPLAASYLLIGLSAAVAGSSLRGARGCLALLVLVGMTGIAAELLWSTYHVEGGSPAAFGWGVVGDDVPWYGTADLAVLLVLAAPAGFVVGQGVTALQRAAAAIAYGPSRGVRASSPLIPSA